jgi:Laminin G domain
MQAEATMRRTKTRVLATLGVVAMSATAVALTTPAQAAATKTVALYNMGEKAGSSVLVDSSGNKLNGHIGSTIKLGAVYKGATGHRYPYLAPNTPPAVPEHLDTVPDNIKLDPETADYAVTIRYRTTHKFGNVIQKGQSTQVGGMWKFQQPNGKMSCLFRGAAGEISVNSGVPLNDGQWHTVRCERTATKVVMTIDGKKKRTGNGPTGMISNSANLSIGGKSNCNQKKVTCDYFVGDIDYVRIEKG